MDFGRIYEEYFRELQRYLLSLCRDSRIAEELTQETFYQAVRSADRFGGRCKVSVWLCQIARHLWYGHLRRQGREVPLPEDETMLPPLPSVEEEHLERWSHLELLRQVHALPEPGREVVYLRVFASLSFREIGELLGRTETWARVTYYRCKERLKTGGDDDEK